MEPKGGGSFPLRIPNHISIPHKDLGQEFAFTLPKISQADNLD